MSKTNLVIIGNGMVGHRFVEELIDKKQSDQFNVTIFCEEPRVAYDRVHLSSYFSGHTAEALSLVREGFYQENNINRRERYFNQSPTERSSLTNGAHC